MTAEQPSTSLAVFIGNDRQTSLSTITAALTLLAVPLGLSVAYQLAVIPTGLPYGWALAGIAGLTLGISGLYVAAKQPFGYLANGVLLGGSVSCAVGSMILLFLGLGVIGDDEVLVIVFTTLALLAAFHSYFNRGILTSWLVVFIPVFGALSHFFAVHGGSFDEAYPIGDALLRAGLFAAPVALLVGTVAFWIGAAAERYALL